MLMDIVDSVHTYVARQVVADHLADAEYRAWVKARLQDYQKNHSGFTNAKKGGSLVLVFWNFSKMLFRCPLSRHTVSLSWCTLQNPRWQIELGGLSGVPRSMDKLWWPLWLLTLLIIAQGSYDIKTRTEVDIPYPFLPGPHKRKVDRYLTDPSNYIQMSIKVYLFVGCGQCILPRPCRSRLPSSLSCFTFQI